MWVGFAILNKVGRKQCDQVWRNFATKANFQNP